MKNGISRPSRRLFYWPLIVALVVFGANVPASAAPAKTILQDTLYKADGSFSAGTLLISWPAFTSADGQAVAAGSMTVKIGAQGTVNVALVPNTGSAPASSYKVTLRLSDGSTSEEYWTVPAAPTTTIAAIRSKVVSAAVAQQFVGRDYVDTKVAQVSADTSGLVHKSGNESVDGVKTFTSAPQVPAPNGAQDAATKQYVDDSQSSAKSYADGTGVAAKSYTDGTVAAAKQYTDAAVAGTVRMASTYADPAWLTSLSATKLTGVAADEVIPAGVARTAGTNTWTSAQTDSALHKFNGGLISTGGLGALASGQAITGSSVSNPAMSIARADNSGPTPGAGILNGWLAPMVRFDLATQSGGVTGSQMAALFNVPAVKGKTWTTTTQSITASGSPQTIAVADSAAFGTSSPDNQALIDPGQGSTITETVSVTAVPDGTHITAIFSKNHTSGARIGVSGRGYKSVAGFAIYDQAGSTNEINGINPNCIINGSGIQGVCSEDDMTTNVASGSYFGDRAGPWAVGHSIINAGSQNSSAGLFIGTSNGSSNFKVGAEIGSGSVAAIAIENAGGGATPTAISVQAAATNGIVIGSDQAAVSNPNFAKSDPTNGIVLTAKGSAAGASSNTVRLESYDSGAAKHTFDLQHGGNTKRLDILYDGANAGIAVNFDGSVQAQQFQVRDVGTNTTRGAFKVSGTTSIATSDVFQTNGTVAASGALRLQSLGSISFRNNANSADVNGLTKNSSDVVSVGGSAGVSTGGMLTAPTYATTTNCASSTGSCAAASAGRVTIAAAATTVTVATTAVTANSEIMVQEDSSLGSSLSVTCNTTLGRDYTVSARTAGTSFVITSSAAPTTNPACLSFRIIN